MSVIFYLKKKEKRKEKGLKEVCVRNILKTSLSANANNSSQIKLDLITDAHI